MCSNTLPTLALDRRKQAKMWEYMGLIRIFTKRKGHPPDFTDPVILSSERSGTNVKAAAQHISREMIDVFNYALVRQWVFYCLGSLT